MKHLSDEERQTLISKIIHGLQQRNEDVSSGEWFDRLVVKVSRRSPRHMEDKRVREAFIEMGEEPPDWSPRDEDWYSKVSEWTIDEMVKIRTREDYIDIEKVVLHKNEQSFNDIIERLNRQLKIKGMLYNRGVDPENEYPKLLSKIWEAMAKWDGRDFTAYIARTIKNYCIDQLKAKKKAFSEIPEVVADTSPASRTRDQAEARDALSHILGAIKDLEGQSAIGPLDGAIFQLILSGRGVTELVSHLVEGPVVPAMRAAFELVAKSKKLSAGEALALRSLLQGLTPDEVSVMSQCDVKTLEKAKQALAPALDDQELADALCRSRLTLTELGRAAKITANAVNLRVNRMRLKIWQTLCDRSYDQLKKRNDALDNIDKAIVQFRCTAQNRPLCKMYKDHRCKREASAADIIQESGLSISEDMLKDRMTRLRDTVLDELGRILPDYNSCVFERKASH